MHHLLAVVWFFYFHYLLGSLIGAFFFLAAFALFGIETGLHRKYVATLLATFEVSSSRPLFPLISSLPLIALLIHPALTLLLIHTSSYPDVLCLCPDTVLSSNDRKEETTEGDRRGRRRRLAVRLSDILRRRGSNRWKRERRP